MPHFIAAKVSMIAVTAQAWTAIDDLPTRQSNWAALLDQLPHTSLHKSANHLAVLDSGPVLQ